MLKKKKKNQSKKKIFLKMKNNLKITLNVKFPMSYLFIINNGGKKVEEKEKLNRITIRKKDLEKR